MTVAQLIDAPVNLLAAALDYAAKGLPVFPCDPATKRPYPGSHGFKDASNDPEKVRAWWSRHPDAMIAIPTGEASKTWVLDVDDPALFNGAALALPATRRCETGKGFHLYFKHDPGVRNSQAVRKDGEKRWPFPSLPGVDVRGDGGYVIVPPSLHPNGRRYTWTADLPIVEAPAELLRIVRKGERSASKAEALTAWPDDATDTLDGLDELERECASIRSAGNGEQEGTLNAAALKIGAVCAYGSLTIDKARTDLIAAGLAMPSFNADKWTVQAVVAKIERGLKDGSANPRQPAVQMRFGSQGAHGRSTHMREGFNPITGDTIEPKQEPTDLPGEAGPDQWDGSRAPPRRFILQDWIVRGAAGLMGGEDGVGKSLMAQLLGTCAATGHAFLGQAIDHCRAIYITCEDPSDELQRRQEAINEGLGINMAALRGWFTTYSLKGQIGNELGTFDSAGRLSPTARYEQIRRAVLDFGAELVFIDNAAHVFAGNENARHDVAAFLGLLERLSIEIDGAVMLLAHPNKQHSQGNKQGNEYSGTTGWSAHVRNRMFLDWNNPDDPDERVLRRSKANYAQKGAEIICRWHQWTFTRGEDLPTDYAAELTQAIKANGENTAFLACLRERAAQGDARAVGPAPGPNYAPSQFEGMREAKGLKKATLKRAMDRLFAIGAIECHTYRNKEKSRDVTVIRETPAGFPNAIPNASRTLSPNAPEPHPEHPRTHTLGITYQSGAALGSAAPDAEVEDPFDPRTWEQGE